MFDPVPSNPQFPQLEEQILAFWKEESVYEKTLARRASSPRFVFYEGPPTANGMPHPGHCLTRAIKDIFPRYRTMRGYLCERKAGWDTHGLPVEVEVCKELGIHSKEEIEAYGVEPFIHKCQESVWRYMQEWERLTERIGFWLKLEEAYVTYHQSYVESVWWSLKNLFDRGLLYQGHKIVWWWAQGGTALSSGEVGEGYRETADPSVFVRFPLLDASGQLEKGDLPMSLLVWTTTPWTLPSNQFAAVHPDLEYTIARDAESGERFVLASALVETVAGKAKREFVAESTLPGSELIGRRYQPPFDYYAKTLADTQGELVAGGQQSLYWRVVAADFVTTDSGSGVVHQAPAFGEVDYEVLQQERERFVGDQGPDLLCAVGPDGKFTAEAPDYQGRWVKEADKDISRELRERGVLFHLDQYLHDYPFCPRAPEDPLIQYPRRSWFIRTTDFKDRMQENNQEINWLPPHIRDGRFGNFLESNVDWALSRERYWGTPLPIWVCQETGQMEAVANYDDLLAKPGIKGTDVWDQAKAAKPELCDDLRVHKPYIDAVTYDSPFAPGARMQRVTEVIDCWYDSGAMPFAQWGYPHQGEEKFEEQFPADFISEAIDQTRGWFYSQLAISTMLFGDKQSSDAPAVRDFPHPFRTCIVLGLMLAEWWEDKSGAVFLSDEDARAKGEEPITKKIGKMSKRLRNYRAPQEIFDAYGADALRWYFFANQAPWSSIIYAERAIKDSIPEFLLRMWNVYRFFVEYANIDGFDPSQLITGHVEQLTADELAQGEGYRPAAQRSELDRWVLSELHRTLRTVVDRMDAYDNYTAAGALNEFGDTLSNWWLRRSRPRFWSSEKDSAAKLDAHWTLYECLVTLAKAIAPFTPFLAETLWQNLAGMFGDRVLQSVHLCDYPTPVESDIDDDLSNEMRLIREVVSLCHNVRKENVLKVRQPLSKAEVVLNDASQRQQIEKHAQLIAEEVNVKLVECTDQADKYITYQVVPNFKALGPRVGKLMPGVKKALAQGDGDAMYHEMASTGQILLTVGDETIALTTAEIEIRLQAKPGWAASQGKNCVVVLSIELTPDLISEGQARDVNRMVQDLRKELDLQMDDRIALAVVTSSEELRAALVANAEYLQRETLAETLTFDPIDDATPATRELGDCALDLYVKRLDR
ncbi:isoleucine--tRNA ligase [Lignipirellula cremea]|uniref:Isoleucine--tRNA ligase n=1 Tax=Lignipirellula cremea TaxID=2528010 RepID=A0A518DV51_9BACT|nr:class I tRNA ligase family protein [Lignipirellula cremea]QDU95713.1 Isoleucine--tRNA ligase [Lignipirellula cremea]